MIQVVFTIYMACGGLWDPAAGDWSKSDATDYRVMTWNVADGLRSGNNKTEGFNNWTALARIVAAMKPDVLLIQEAGDHGCFNCVDSVAELTEVMDLFIRGGTDPFLGGAVTAYVQKYAPAFDLPYVSVSGGTDGFNRNLIASRYPFVDLNGDTKSTISDIPLVVADLYAPGGNGGIRGFQFVEIDLPDNIYTGDAVVGNAHLKAGGSSSDRADRLKAAQNVAYVVDYWFNGAGSGIPDPNDKLFDNPPATTILDLFTPVILGGDWNEDEDTNGRRGPAEWLVAAEITGGTDGTDRDRSDMVFDSATHVFTGNRATFGTSSKLDYVATQDSIAPMRRAFVFDTSGTPTGALPSELTGFPFPGGASSTASDHRPVIVDLIMPLAAGCTNDEDCDDGDPCNGVERCDPKDGCYTEPIIDCNLNGLDDACDIENEISADCNQNGIPDECDILSGFSLDEDENGVPDECEVVVPAASTWSLLAAALGLMSAGTVLAQRNATRRELT